MKKMYKRNPIRLLVTIGALLTFLIAFNSYAKTTVKWHTFRYVPYYFGPGNAKKGIGEEILDYYIKHLPEYKHVVKEEPIKRLYYEMSREKKEAVCSPVKTELPPAIRGGTVKTKPNLILPAPGIVVAKKKLSKYFNGGKNVSIAELLKNENLTLGWLIGGTYSPGIAKEIRKYENLDKVPKHLELHAKLKGSFIKMLQHDRIDYYVSHSITAAYQIKDAGLNDKLEFVSVVEAPGISNTYAFCSNTKLGNEVMKKLRKITNSKEYTVFLSGLIKKFLPKKMVPAFVKKNNLHKQYN